MRHRESILVIGMAIIALITALPLQALQAPPTAVDKHSPSLWLTNRGLVYDSSTHLVGLPSNGAPPHALGTRESAWYANVLLATDRRDDREKAVRILWAVLAAQDRAHGSRWYGLWPHHVGEAMSDSTPVDMNWGEFMGFALLGSVMKYSKVMPPSLVASADSAILRAVGFLANRALGPHFHNMWVLNTSVLLEAAQYYHDAKLEARALARLDTLRRMVVVEHDLSEYNSPTYLLEVDLDALTKMRQVTTSLAIRGQLTAVERVLCQNLVAHYDAPRGQIAGPQSRAYDVLLDGSDQDLLASALGLNGRRPDCPDPVNLPQSTPRTEIDTFIPIRANLPVSVDRSYLGGIVPVIGTTYLTSLFSLGSTSVGDFWNQRRPILAYWGTRAAPGYLRVRMLVNGDDDATAQVFTRQRQGSVLAAVAFATDVAAAHPDLIVDSLHAEVRDLRLRFEFGGDTIPEKVQAPSLADAPVSIRVAGVPVIISAPLVAVNGLTPRWEVQPSDKTRSLDLVLYHGAGISGRVGDWATGILAVTIQVGDQKAAPFAIADTSRGAATIIWQELHIQIPVRPMTLDSLHVMMRRTNSHN